MKVILRFEIKGEPIFIEETDLSIMSELPQIADEIISANGEQSGLVQRRCFDYSCNDVTIYIN